jgi:hypothetical protein
MLMARVGSLRNEPIDHADASAVTCCRADGVRAGRLHGTPAVSTANAASYDDPAWVTSSRNCTGETAR